MSPSPDRTVEWNAALERIPASIRTDVDSIWDTQGSLPAQTVGRILQTAAIDIGTLMMQLLPFAATYAVVPVSGYHVGAVAAGMPSASGPSALYLGANFEFGKAALSFTVHAEQAATNHAWLRGEPGLVALAVSEAPCGYCRQFLYELSTAQKLNVLLALDPPDPTRPFGYTSNPLTYFLPLPFGPGNLGQSGGLMSPGSRRLSLDGSPSIDTVMAAALAAACACYAPYGTPDPSSYAYAGAAVLLDDGSICAGRHAENVAYNPSLSPLESALAFMNMTRPLSATRQVKRCVLIEVPTLASQLSATRAVLGAYNPYAPDVEYYTASVVP